LLFFLKVKRFEKKSHFTDVGRYWFCFILLAFALSEARVLSINY
jgi:hypothetical protein